MGVRIGIGAAIGTATAVATGQNWWIAVGLGAGVVLAALLNVCPDTFRHRAAGDAEEGMFTSRESPTNPQAPQ